MPTMQVLLSITFNLDFKTAKFLHLKIIKNNTFSGAASRGAGQHVARQCGATCCHERRGGVSPDICKFIAQGTVQLFATASHCLDVAANIESIY